ncbi:MAG: ABC transporter ATP-binding protein/permease [Anaerolineae bacterium]|nr:ABC transporter ATP-binding protein/permease [Anaerolineae bacterium]MCO5196299.1 ABC transporter ATP-binding protein/permease [Anaerolineae bacterium]
MTRSIKSQSPLRRLMQYARPYRRRVFLATLYSILNKLFDLAPPILIGLAVDVLVLQDDSILGRMGVENVTTQLLIVAGLTLVVWILESVFEYFYSIYWRNLAQDLQNDARMDAYKHVQELEMAYYEARSTGGLMAVLNDDVNQLERFLDVGANEIIQLMVTVIAIGSYFMIVAPSVAWMAVLPMPFIVYGSIRFQKRLEPLYAKVREQVGWLNTQLSNNLGGIATVKSFTAEAHEIGRIGTLSTAYADANRNAITYSSAFTPLIRMVIVTGFIGIMIFGGQLVIAGGLAVGVYSTMIYMTQRLLWPLTRLGQTLDLYQRAMASTARIFDVIDTPIHIVDGVQSLPVESVRGDVRFETVEFAYDPSVPVLQGLSIDVPAGQTAAFVGATGAGKSTIIKLLLRFYDVNSGHVTLDGHDVRELKLQDLRKAIGLVSQDVYLFHGTVRENIAYGTFDASLDDIVAAAKIAEAHDFITELPDGYDTVVGERGQKLSGGQRQRLSIARAVLKDPPVLILDEATSSVDNETEAAIQRSMERIAIGRTTIIIAHRLSTIRNADMIYVLERGRLREQGHHEELVAADGVYADLWRIQTGERISDF